MPNKKLLIISFLLIFSSAFFPQQSHAQDNLSIGYSPANNMITLEQGDLFEDKVVFWNLADEEITYNIYISGFKQIGDNPGTSLPLSPEEDKNDPYSASSWIKVEDETITLPSNKNVELKYIINVPSNVALGEYSAKLFLTSEKIDEQNENFDEAVAKTNLASGPPILIQIGDNTEMNQDLDLLKFTSNKTIYGEPEVIFETELENSGNTHVTPSGSIFIKNITGEIVKEIPFSEGNLSLLRGTNGTYKNTWFDDGLIISEDGKLIVGPMDAELLITYKTINPGYSPLSATTSFWIIPWKLILAILAAIILLIVVITVVIKRRKSKKNKNSVE